MRQSQDYGEVGWHCKYDKGNRLNDRHSRPRWLSLSCHRGSAPRARATITVQTGFTEEHVVLKVADDGCGFTRDREGRGTTLSLYLSRCPEHAPRARSPAPAPERLCRCRWPDAGVKVAIGVPTGAPEPMPVVI
jgi:hypothetical protein